MNDNPAERASVTIASIVGGFALVVLVAGWILDVSILRTFLPMWTPMAPLTAVLLLALSGAVIWFERRRMLANALLLISSVLAAVILTSYFFDVDLGVIELSLLFHRRDTLLPELPAPDMVTAVLMLALALACLRTANRHLHDFADVVAAVIGILCLQVLIGYAYSVAQSDQFTGYRQIAPHSTVSIMLLAFTAFARRPSLGIFAAMSGENQSASLLRRLLPTTILLCVIMGWLHLLAIQEHIGGTVPEIVAWSVTGAVVVLSLLLFVASAEMRRVESQVRRRQEELLAATAAAEAASEAKSRFMGVMSHELRTPLTAMIGYADLIDSELAGELSSDARGYMQRIRASGWHLVGLIDAVLFYAGGKPPADHAAPTRLDLCVLLREIISMFAVQAADKSLTISFDAPAEAVFADVDQRKLRQILINLLSNAVKFTEQGSIVVSLRASADTVRIEVRDTGIGIEPADLQRIWEPFALIDASHTRTQGGMGLGLALTRRLTDQLGARINAVSTSGQGAIFTLELPKSEPRDRMTPELSGARILVVDDEPTVRRIMARSLARYGSEITEADSAAAALEIIARQDKMDALVTDISMPGMTGIQLAQQLVAEKFGAPILFVTGAELDGRDLASIDALGARVLRKPFDMVELARAVEQLIRA